MSHVIVLGAGPTGLMAAWQLVAAGHDCTVLEAADHVGGMAGSFSVAGQRVDYGSHRLHPATPPKLLAAIGDLLGDDLQVRPRSGRLRLAERWVGFPLRAGELIRTLPPLVTGELALDAAATAFRGLVGGQESASFADEVTARLGTRVTERFYGPYARKLYGTEPDQLDRELAQRRVSAGSPGDILRRLIRARQPSGRTFLYPTHGYGQIVEALADAAVDGGATIALGEPATKLSVGADRVTVGSDHRTLDGELVLSTIPLPRLAALLEPGPGPTVQGALDRLRTRAMLLVYVVVDRPQYTAFDAHYIPGPETCVARLSEPKNYRMGPDPVGQTVLCAEIPCWGDDDLVHRSADDLAAKVVDDLARLGLPAVTPIGAEKRLLPSVYPVFDRVGRSDRAVVDAWSQGLGRVIPIGRQGLRVIDNLHHVMRMGEVAAAAVTPDGLLDQEIWSAGLASFAEHTVED